MIRPRLLAALCGLLTFAAMAPAAPRPMLYPPKPRDVTELARDDTAVYQWRGFVKDSSQITLWKFTPDGWEQIGGYSFATETYHPRIAAGEWGPVCKAPIDPPEAFRHRHRRWHPRPRPKMNFGITLDRMPGATLDRTIYRDHTGQEISREQALRLLGGKAPKKRSPPTPQRPPQATPSKRPPAGPVGGPALPDDAKKPWFVLVGSPTETAAVLAELDATGQRERFRVQVYDPAADDRLSWPAKRGNFPAGHPAIVIEDANGVAVSTTLSDPGQDGLVRLLKACPAALWEPDPHFDPAQVPDLSQPSVLGVAGVHPVTAGVGIASLAVLGGAGVVLARRKKKAV